MLLVTPVSHFVNCLIQVIMNLILHRSGMKISLPLAAFCLQQISTVEQAEHQHSNQQLALPLLRNNCTHLDQ